MTGHKALFSRRSSSFRDHYLSVVSGEDGETGVELGRISLNVSASVDDGSVFLEENHTHTNHDTRKLDDRRVQSSALSAFDEIRRQKARSVGSDHTDMPIESSKDVSNGFKRKTSEHRDIVYHFNALDFIIGIGSIIIYFVDIVTDVKLAVDYFLDSRWLYGGVTTALIIGPSLVTCCFGLHWYIIDYKTEKKVIQKSRRSKQQLNHVTPSSVWFLRFFFTALQFGPVVRTIEYLYYGCKSRSLKIDEKSRRRFHWWMLYEDVDNCLLRLFESFLESAPQLCWQLYITIKSKPSDDVIGTTTRAVALLSSWASLAISLVSYHRSLRNSREDKDKMKICSIPFYFLWRASEIGGRVLCIAMFASAFDLWVFGIVLFHWLVNAVWLMNQRTTFYGHSCLEKVFNVICGYVMLFCFLNLREGHTRYRFFIYYLIFYIENFFMLAFWFRFTPDLGEWFHIWGFIVVLIFFILHIMFQLMYYSCCHPTDAIKPCLPCDKYTFYESVCYDVRPEIDDGIGSPNKRYTSKEMLQDSELVPQLMTGNGAVGDPGQFCNISLVEISENNESHKPCASHQDRIYTQHRKRVQAENHTLNPHDEMT